MLEDKGFLTATDYYKFLQCPHWPYYDLYATDEEKKLKRELTPGEQKRLENGVTNEKEIIDTIKDAQEVVEAPQTKNIPNDFASTLELMRKGVPLIYQGTLMDGDHAGRPDLLKKVQGQSVFGDWYYVPMDIKSSHEVEKYHRLQLMFYAVLLESIQERFPGRGYIINKDGEMEVELGENVAEFEEITKELEAIRAGEKPEPVLRKTCKETGVWGEVCQKYAESLNDIALLFNVDVNKLKALRELKVRTIQDAAEMDIMDLDGKAPGLRLHGLEVAKLQAQSLLRSQVIVREPIFLPAAVMEIHFDIESDPPNDTDYLFGLLIRTPQGQEYKAFVARSLEEEGKMWHEFLDWLATLNQPYQVMHYASFERIRLNVLRARYGGSPHLDLFMERMVDLKKIATSSLVFPLYFYGLKYIAKFLGFSWRGNVKGGGQSVDVFEEYLRTKNEDLLQQIITYNEDDVRATAVLADWCRAYAGTRTAYDKPFPWESGIPSSF
ncbi:MAG: TM0106 family RecB-like putative nuclease [Patescibacteria group bacterium]